MGNLLKRKTGIKVKGYGLSPAADAPSQDFYTEPETLMSMELDEEPEQTGSEEKQVFRGTEPEKKKKWRAGKIVGTVLTVLFALLWASSVRMYGLGYRIGVYTDEQMVTNRALIRPGQTGMEEMRLLDEDRVYHTDRGVLREYRVERASEYSVTADGKDIPLRGASGGVSCAWALQKAGVTLGELDRVSPALDDLLEPGGAVKVSRVRTEEVTVTEEIAYEGTVKYSPLLRTGSTLDIYPDYCHNGSREVTYRDTYVDGELESREEIGEKVTREPVNYVKLTGKNVRMSPIDGSRYTDVRIVDNAPTSYSAVYSGKATAYNFSGHCYGGSGMYLSQGMVATDPALIPYGSLLWITSSDGSFVYGWAVAADACEAAMEGRVLVDCFFDTYKESCLFGAHTMNVYVVEQLHRSQLREYRANDMFNRIPA